MLQVLTVVKARLLLFEIDLERVEHDVNFNKHIKIVYEIFSVITKGNLPNSLSDDVVYPVT